MSLPEHAGHKGSVGNVLAGFVNRPAIVINRRWGYVNRVFRLLQGLLQSRRAKTDLKGSEPVAAFLKSQSPSLRCLCGSERWRYGGAKFQAQVSCFFFPNTASYDAFTLGPDGWCSKTSKPYDTRSALVGSPFT